MKHILAAIVCLVAIVPALNAEVTRIEIDSRTMIEDGRAFGAVGAYEELVGRVFFSVDPANVRNQVIVDLDLAPVGGDGMVETSADITIVAPVDPARGNSVALVEVANRGRQRIAFNRAEGAGSPYGDGFLMNRGYTLVWVGWEFDVADNPALVRIEVPTAEGTTGRVVTRFVTNSASDTTPLGDLRTYPSIYPATPEGVLSRIDDTGAAVAMDRALWSLDGTELNLRGGFEPGRTYELSYIAEDPAIAGLGFAAIRDTATWLKHSPDALVSTEYAIAFGSSQSGRFLRNFLYLGFNSDEAGRQVFDGVIPHIAGASRIDLNRRWSTPVSQGQFTATSFPFADAAYRDPVTGAVDGTLANQRSRENQPRVFYTNTSVEYWGGGRVAAMVHTTPDGLEDLSLPDNVRFYLLAGTQHGPGRFPPSVGTGQQMGNPTDYWWSMRALLVAMEEWVTDGVEPPPSAHPRLGNGTLVPVPNLAFPSIPGVRSPHDVTTGVRAANALLPDRGGEGAPLLLLVPGVDEDGNEVSGIRHPEVTVPLATYTGWNFRNTAVGRPDQLYPLAGGYIPFAANRTEREQQGDPRRSILERYESREAYLGLVETAGLELVAERYLLAEDLAPILERAGAHWDLLVGGN